MKPELKTKWVEALRSGQYQQGQGDLKVGSGYCCLGVLLDVSKRGAWEGTEYVIHDDGERHIIAGELEGHAKSFGLTSEQETVLIRMNDGRKEWDGKPQPFEVIADYIEKKL